MHHLHPRSRTTSTLFTTTLAISFLVVSLPHLLPCPVDCRQFADTIEMPDGTIKRRRRRRRVEEEGAVSSVADGETGGEVSEMLGSAAQSRPKRECPVPKPVGLMGQIMGFEQRGREGPSEVVVRSLGPKRVKQQHQQEGTDGVDEGSS